MRATWLSRLSVLPLLLAATVSAVACGDDGEAPAATPTDAGMNGTTTMDGGGGPMVIPRRDAQVSETPDPITPCQRSDANACPAGEVCDLLVRLFPGDDRYTLYTGCLKAERERGEGDPCNPDPTAGQPYELEGLSDPLYRDICGPGLVCAPNRKVRGAFSCQTSCSSGAISDQPFSCEDPTALCASSQVALGEFCRKADGCSVEKQTGCLGGEACYLIPSPDQKQLLAFCSPEPMMPDNDGQPCGLVSCKAGSVCLGPVNQPISAWSDTNMLCRAVCNGQSGQAPANDEDAGVPSGLCSATTRCAAFAESGLLLSSIPTPPFGQCESQ